MIKRCFLGLTACLAVTLFVGCSANQGLVRGQSPAFTPEGYSTDQTATETEYNEGAQYISEDEYCDDCGEEISELEYLLKLYWLHELYPHGLFNHHGTNGTNKFTQRAERFSEQAERVSRGERVDLGKPPEPPVYEHNYRVYRPHPDELKYPAQNSPGAVVQYPYYIHKGPDDFFLN